MAKICDISTKKVKSLEVDHLIRYASTYLPDDCLLVVSHAPYFLGIDAVLITPNKVYAIKTDACGGNITAKSYGKWLRDNKQIENPMKQVRDIAVRLAKFLREAINKEEIFVDGLLVFTNKISKLNLNEMDSNSYKGVKVLKLEEINNIISKASNNKTRTEEIKEFFIRFEAELKNYTKALRILPNFLIKVTTVILPIVFLLFWNGVIDGKYLIPVVIIFIMWIAFVISTYSISPWTIGKDKQDTSFDDDDDFEFLGVGYNTFWPNSSFKR